MGRIITTTSPTSLESRSRLLLLLVPTVSFPFTSFVPSPTQPHLPSLPPYHKKSLGYALAGSFVLKLVDEISLEDI
ncbi:hypothetical protein MLD38_024938 [Melastoma candidum]|uniref:Uncharacterized protein n=1 Tax=Melastoma candidum TaxID=119954 RepID=A0ACB9NUS7_9MYRT|nr:hypothetical protein MLD38_024938 [Melastoma candidum]